MTAPIRKICLSQPKLVDWLIGLPCAIAILLSFPIFAFATATIYNLHDVALEGATSFLADATHVPTIYSPKHKSKYLHTLLLTVLASTFGALHCAGWNFPFPNYAEKTLWRVSPSPPCRLFSSSSFSPPFALTPRSGWKTISCFFNLRIPVGNCKRHTPRSGHLLRQLPQNTFTTISWIRFYPHIF